MVCRRNKCFRIEGTRVVQGFQQTFIVISGKKRTREEEVLGNSPVEGEKGVNKALDEEPVTK